MKKTISLLLIVFVFGVAKSFAQAGTQTEEYAIVDVLESGKMKIIRTSIGNQPSTEKEWKEKKTEFEGDLSPVISELNRLNALGYTLLNMSSAYNPMSGYGASTGTAKLTFMMVKKLKTN